MIKQYIYLIISNIEIIEINKIIVAIKKNIINEILIVINLKYIIKYYKNIIMIKFKNKFFIY